MITKPNITSLLIVCFFFANLSLAKTAPYNVINVPAQMETQVAIGQGDKIDDPALWFNTESPNQSLILGTNKRLGIYLYDMQGRKVGEDLRYVFNNIDLKYVKDPDDNEPSNIIVGSYSDGSGFSVLTYNSEQKRLDVLAERINTTVKSYGICLGRTDNDEFVVFITGKEGNIDHFEIEIDDDELEYDHVRTLSIATKNEGCVVDEENEKVYVSEEERGLWQFDLDEDENKGRLIAEIGRDPWLASDLEGIGLYNSHQKKLSNGLIILSIQGRNEFAVLDLKSQEYKFSFHIAASENTDEVTHTDGIDVFSHPLPGFPFGGIIVQDDVDFSGNEQGQNFKVVNMKHILESI